ncbi:hypothetical protein BC831DRAFT_476019 [Entophlyctis helioformis]|nr:hypothetical protein BC831DRAFT_476019 [Entophlyctis helioformis]
MTSSDPAWVAALQESIKRNYGGVLAKEPVSVQLASVKADGTPKLQHIVAQEQLWTDAKVLVFTGPNRNTELMSVLKGTKNHEVLWHMPKTNETFSFTGRIYIAAAPSLSHRFGSPPKRIGVPDSASSSPRREASFGTNGTNGSAATPIDPEVFWEGERLRLWRSISPTYRATFSWPASGEMRSLSESASWSVYEQPVVKVATHTVDVGFKFTTMDAMTMPRDSASLIAGSLGRNASSSSIGSTSPVSRTALAFSTLGRTSPQRSTASFSGQDTAAAAAAGHALDNFCLLVFKPIRVDHVAPTPRGPPVRLLYTATKEGEWSVQDVNP